MRQSFSAPLLSAVALCLLSSAAASTPDNLFVASSTSNEVYRYLVQPGDSPVLDLTLTANLDRPSYLALDPSMGELFVVNRGNAGGGSGSVARFLDPNGTASPNGTIADVNGSGGFDFNLPHGVALRGTELFVVNSFSDNVLRFTFNGSGVASSSGIISGNPSNHNARGIVIGPQDDLFVTQANSTSNQMVEYGFDGSGVASFLRNISSPGSNDHGMVFSPWGELFVTEAGSNSVARILFDSGGLPLANGQLTGNDLNSPIGVTFSPWGELFVANSGVGRICRWMFTPAHVAAPNGSFTTPQPVAGLSFGTHNITGVTGNSTNRAQIRLGPATPNPAPRGCQVALDLPKSARVSADVLDVRGRRMVVLSSDALLGPGRQTLKWNGRGADGEPVPIGLYFLRARAGEWMGSTPIVILH